MVIHKKFGLKDSILVSEVTKVTFHPVSGYGLVSDIDGNVYRTVIIGNKEWMVENLRTTHLNDGTPIPEINDGTEWMNDTLRARCAYNGNLFQVPKYGFLYNVFSVKTGKLAPDGWRVTTLSDWKELENAFGTGPQLAYAIRDTGNADWSYYDPNVTNESGLTILPAGRRFHDYFVALGELSDFWTTSPSTYSSGFYFAFRLISSSTHDTRAYEQDFPNYDGHSVRCVRDISQ